MPENPLDTNAAHGVIQAQVVETIRLLNAHLRGAFVAMEHLRSMASSTGVLGAFVLNST